MSTKVYGMYKVAMSTKDFFIKITEIQHNWYSKLTEMLAIDISILTLQKLENNKEIKRDVYFKGLRNTFSDFLDDIAGYQHSAMRDYDGKVANDFYLAKYDNNIVVYFYNNEVYFQIFSNSANFTEMITDSFQENIREFSYQNQTDAPDDIPLDDWREREKVIEGIFKDSGIPRHCGLCIGFDTIASFSDVFLLINENSSMYEI